MDFLPIMFIFGGSFTFIKIQNYCSMRKILALLLTLVMALSINLQLDAKGKDKYKYKRSQEFSEFLAHVDNFSFKDDGVFSMHLKGFAVGMMKTAAKAAAKTEEEKAAAKFLDGIKGILMVEYSEVPAEVKERFDSGLKLYLDKLNMIVDITEEDTHMTIYGKILENNTLIENIILYSPEECVIMGIEGVIGIDNIDDVVNMGIK